MTTPPALPEQLPPAQAPTGPRRPTRRALALAGVGVAAAAGVPAVGVAAPGPDAAPAQPRVRARWLLLRDDR